MTPIPDPERPEPEESDDRPTVIMLAHECSLPEILAHIEAGRIVLIVLELPSGEAA
jgi:hypothetical protein